MASYWEGRTRKEKHIHLIFKEKTILFNEQKWHFKTQKEAEEGEERSGNFPKRTLGSLSTQLVL